MPLISFLDGPDLLTRVLDAWGQALGRRAKSASDGPAPLVAYNLAGTLYLSETGWLLLSVPNALVRGIFAAMHEPGAELPPGPGGKFNAHITVMDAEELERIGGAEKVTERGKQFKYSLGRMVEVEPSGWPGMAKAWLLRVHSPELQRLRRSYGLSSLPRDGKHDFHCTVGVLRKGVLGRTETAKGDTSDDAPGR